MSRYQYPHDVEATMDQFAADNPNAGWREVVREFERAMLTSRWAATCITSSRPQLMTDESNKPPISLAAARAERERDFRQERLDLTKELVEIGVDESRLAALVQHTMEIEWAVFKSGLMLQYHGLDQDARSIVELTKLIVREK